MIVTKPVSRRTLLVGAAATGAALAADAQRAAGATRHARPMR